MNQPDLFIPSARDTRRLFDGTRAVRRHATADEAIRSLTARDPDDPMAFMGLTWSNEHRMGRLDCRACGKDSFYRLAAPRVACPSCGATHLEVVGRL